MSKFPTPHPIPAQSVTRSKLPPPPLFPVWAGGDRDPGAGAMAGACCVARLGRPAGRALVGMALLPRDPLSET